MQESNYSRTNGTSGRPLNGSQNRVFPPRTCDGLLAGSPRGAPLLRALQNPSDFEVVGHGPLANIQNPGQTIVIRERESEEWPDGTFSRIYGFALGHIEILKTPDGKFEEWERERLFRP